MLISRRSLLLGAVVTSVVAACSSDAADGPSANVDRTVPLEPVRTEAQPNPDKSKVPPSVIEIGDSISALAQPTLEAVLADIGFTEITVNAESSRRIAVGQEKPTNGLDVIKFIAGSGSPDVWVVALGTNDAGLYVTDDDYRVLIDDVLAVIPEDKHLVWVSVYRNDLLEGCVQFNRVLRQRLDERGMATVADWYQRVLDSGGSVLIDDGVHPNGDGLLVFADTVRAGIAARLS